VANLRFRTIHLAEDKTQLRTITFYSYKGGTGRTLAVANTARFLARFGYRVFVLDLDLEAPGLHYKLGLRSEKGGGEPVKGVVDFLEDFTTTGSVPELSSYVREISNLPPTFEGSIWLMPAGDAPSPKYSKQLADIRLPELFNPLKAEAGSGANPSIPIGVPLFLELKNRIERDYQADYLLIDSRTGITEIGGAAVGLLPDTVVCLVHNNPENLDGARKILRNVKAVTTVEGGSSTETVVALTRLPEMQRGKETEILNRVKEYFNAPDSKNTAQSLTLSEILILHSDPNLQITESLLIGADTTANESILLRDYFKLFLRLGLDKGLPSEVSEVLAGLAEADSNDNIRPLLVGGRRLRGESALAPVKMKERLQARCSSTLKVVSPEYLDGPTYVKLIKDVRERLCQRESLKDVDPIPPKEVRWDLLAVHLREGVLDFCEDIYYLTENRSHLTEIVQLGWCHTFTVCVRKNSKVDRRLSEDSKEGFDKSMLRLLTETESMSVGVLGDTPAASEANRRLSPFLKPTQLISKGSEEDLLHWLEGAENSGEQRIAVCDHVVAEKLKSLKYQGSTKYSSNVFNFAQPVPVGIVYPREDREWRREISRSIAYSLRDFLQTERWDAPSGPSVAGDFRDGGIAALSYSDLRLSLMLDLTFDEALDLNLPTPSGGTGGGSPDPQD
jgi:MinD-like ATPase involved in chromosome partitioning or flagellar assembly